MQKQTRLRTTGEIAKWKGIPTHRVEYAIERYRIQETQRAGIIRLYDEVAIAAIESALRRIQQGG